MMTFLLETLKNFLYEIYFTVMVLTKCYNFYSRFVKLIYLTGIYQLEKLK